MTVFAFLSLSTAIPTDSIAATTACSLQDAEAADAAVDKLDSWHKVQAFRIQYGRCDDGSIAEGNSEAVARLFVDHWDTVPVLVKLMRQDRSLKAFVLHHVDATLDTADLTRIGKLAVSDCPRGAASFCKELGAAAGRALR